MEGRVADDVDRIVRRSASLPMSATRPALACPATSATVAAPTSRGRDVGEVEPGKAGIEQIGKSRRHVGQGQVTGDGDFGEADAKQGAAAGKSASRWAIREIAWLALRPDGEINAPSATTASPARQQLLRDQRRQEVGAGCGAAALENERNGCRRSLADGKRAGFDCGGEAVGEARIGREAMRGDLVEHHGSDAAAAVRPQARRDRDEA